MNTLFIDISRMFYTAYINLANLLPYVLLGVFISELLKFVHWDRLLQKKKQRRTMILIPLAALTGVISPLCTYGTLPIIITLLGAGITTPVLITFLSASSLMNPQLFVITSGAIGLKMGVARVAAALVFSAGFGFFLTRVSKDRIIRSTMDKQMSRKPVDRSFIGFVKRYWNTLQYIGFYIVLGTLLGAAVETFVPVTWVAAVFQKHIWLAVLLGALLGIPLYACGGGVIPLIESMLESGMDPGAALAFFIVGPATRITPLVALSTILRPRFIMVYVIVLIIFAVGAGLLYS